MASQTVENYIKAIYQLAERDGSTIATTAISEKLKTTSASVTDMLKKLAGLELIEYKKYHGVQLSDAGKSMAIQILRKHRLWETFLFEKLNIPWDQVHFIAEQLEHIEAPKLVDQLDTYLKFPKFDPHGDPIPDQRGRFTLRNQILMSQLLAGDYATIVAVKSQEGEFLQYLDSIGISLNISFHLLEKVHYDGSLRMEVLGKEILLSPMTSQNIYVRKSEKTKINGEG